MQCGRVLILSLGYLPEFSADTLQTWMMAEGLAERGWDTHVLSASLFERYPSDRSIPRNPHVRVTSLSALPALMQAPLRTLISREGRIRLQAWGTWIIAKRMLRTFQPTHVLALYGAGFLAGMKIARASGAAYVPYFIDPFRRNLYRDDRPRATRWYNRQTSVIANAATKILFPNVEMAQEELAPFPQYQRKVILLPHGVSRTFVPDTCTPPTDTTYIRAAHVGNLYGKRSMAPLLDALDILRMRAPHAYARLRIDMYGNTPPRDRARAQGHGTVFQWQPFLPYAHVMERQKQYHFLFLIEPPVLPYNNLTSKLLESLAQGKFVFGITPSSSVSTTILTSYGHVAANIFSREDIAEKLEQTIGALIADPRRSCREIVHDYDDDRLVTRLDAALRAAADAFASERRMSTD